MGHSNESKDSSNLYNDKNAIIKSLMDGLAPDEDLIHNASPGSKKFLNYYPGLTRFGRKFTKELLRSSQPASKEAMLEYFSHDGRLLRYPTILECWRDPLNLQYIRGGLEKLIEDAADTTDEDSSDDDADQETILNPALSHLTNHRKLSRGVHLSPAFFTSRQRKEVRQPENHQRTVYSLATIALANTIGFVLADKQIKEQCSALYVDNNIQRERDKDGKLIRKRTSKGKEISFANRFYQLIHIYVNQYGYENLFKNEGVERNFNFPVSKNIFISTSYDVNKAIAYALGTSVVDNNLLYIPRKRKSTGVFKHRRVGYVETYYLSDSSVCMIDVDALNEKKLIAIGQQYRFNQEVIILSSIPAEFIFSYKMFSIPSNRRDEETVDKLNSAEKTIAQQHTGQIRTADQQIKCT